ncbi:hypothetical protein A2368_00905 [Candidatus Collierbacteria bacterium RIFOXYB1_FULL_49_13]|uniref:nicotinamidase n=1 Tax=Candidatus Collierbacteria bacterium RIFOXYB1_FULL_49_13 TaxID=1817728 RepID=A0A1F5FHI8_9BACT|nr:MAG: hypothetical protein A2368_00905 [Candidatus Collierbacteria bacterium RIFOXYB1_FULL_49_13]
MKFQAVRLETPSRLTENDAAGAVDVQPTFMPKGGLAVAGGDLIIWICVRIFELFARLGGYLFATEDVHPYGHVSLASSYIGLAPFTKLTLAMVKSWDPANPPIAKHAKFTYAQLIKYLETVKFQVLWPDHALAGQPETYVVDQIRRHPFLNLWISKGHRRSRITGIIPDSYAAGAMNDGLLTGLIAALKEIGITRIFVFGLAGDFCVGATALSLLAAGFEVWVVVDAQCCVAAPLDSADFDSTIFVQLGDNPTTEDLMVFQLVAAGCHFTNFDLLSQAA